jgi:2-polyprenyl-3-methyl-5-hydroxy-6-metoxy-1,4-benzoquinol methylase
MTCKICGSSDPGKTHVAREMMLGLRDEFTYFECAECGSLQLIDVPPDMSRYYPDNYYSYVKGNSLGAFVRGQRAAYARNGLNPIGALMSYLYGPDRALESIARLPLHKDASILDVGCGSGGLLLNLKRLGFTNLTGTDPFLSADQETNGIRLLKGEVFEVQGEFDVVMLHHAFEHMSEPAQVLEQLNRILRADGVVILRTPVSDGDAWRDFGVNWHQLDAPRHLIVHTVKSMTILAKAAGLSISEIVYDSTLLQFIVSEEYQHGISQADQKSYTHNPIRSIFSLSQIRSLRDRARRLNETKRGDSACFYLRKVQQNNR